MLHDYISVFDMVPRDYEAMYAYKCGLFEQCFRLSQESVDFLLYSESSRFARVLNDRSDLLLLMDDDYLSIYSLARLFDVFKSEIIENVSLSAKQTTIAAFYDVTVDDNTFLDYICHTHVDYHEEYQSVTS